jgi:hypothetical protein
MGLEQVFELSNENRSVELSVSNNFISIKRIIITSLLGLSPNDWSTQLTRLNPCLEFSYRNIQMEMEKFTLSLNGYISSFVPQPIIEFFGNLIIPRENIFTPIRRYDSVTIELTYNDSPDTKIRVMIIYEYLP